MGWGGGGFVAGVGGGGFVLRLAGGICAMASWKGGFVLRLAGRGDLCYD